MTLCEGKTVGISMIFRKKNRIFPVKMSSTGSNESRSRAVAKLHLHQFSKDPKNPEHVSSVRAFFQALG